MMMLDQSSCNPEGLTSSFGWSGRDEVVQHDVQELNRVLFNAIEQSLVGTQGGLQIDCFLRVKYVISKTIWV